MLIVLYNRCEPWFHSSQRRSSWLTDNSNITT